MNSRGGHTPFGRRHLVSALACARLSITGEFLGIMADIAHVRSVGLLMLYAEKLSFLLILGVLHQNFKSNRKLKATSGYQTSFFAFSCWRKRFVEAFFSLHQFFRFFNTSPSSLQIFEQVEFF